MLSNVGENIMFLLLFITFRYKYQIYDKKESQYIPIVLFGKYENPDMR